MNINVRLYGIGTYQMLRLKTIFILLTISLLAGCYELEKIWHYGTTKGVSLCIENNSDTSELLSESLVRTQCIKEHTKDLPYKHIGGSAYLRTDGNYLNVRISDGKNLYENFIITGFTLHGDVYDADGKAHESSQVLADVWIEPGKDLQGSGKLEFDFPVDDFDGTCAVEKDKRKSCSSWTMDSFRGLELRL